MFYLKYLIGETEISMYGYVSSYRIELFSEIAPSGKSVLRQVISDTDFSLV